jgi:hypothetical protein
VSHDSVAPTNKSEAVTALVVENEALIQEDPTDNLVLENEEN